MTSPTRRSPSWPLGRSRFSAFRWQWVARIGSACATTWNGRALCSAGTADNTDLELIGTGYVERRENASYGAWFRITPNGERALAAQHQLEIATRQPHHDLGSRLAEWLRSEGRITRENIECRIEELELPTLASAYDVDPATVSRYLRPGRLFDGCNEGRESLQSDSPRNQGFSRRLPLGHCETE